MGLNHNEAAALIGKIARLRNRAWNSGMRAGQEPDMSVTLGEQVDRLHDEIVREIEEAIQ